jgi:hypothetical protein
MKEGNCRRTTDDRSLALTGTMDEKNKKKSRKNTDGIVRAVRVLPPGLSLLLASVVRVHRLSVRGRPSSVGSFLLLFSKTLTFPHISSHSLRREMLGTVAVVRFCEQKGHRRPVVFPGGIV